MPTDVIMPQMGESIFEGTITKWLKQPGEKVQRDEPLFEISTDKVDAEIPAPASGTLQDIKVQAGATVQVNTVVGTIAAEGDGAARSRRGSRQAGYRPGGDGAGCTDAEAAAASAEAQKPPKAAQNIPADLVEGREGRPGAPGAGQRCRNRKAASRTRSLQPAGAPIAKENNVDLAQVSGTGLGGRITKEDIEGFIAQARQRRRSGGSRAAHRQPAAAAAPAAPAAAELRHARGQLRRCSRSAASLRAKSCPCRSCARRLPSTWSCRSAPARMCTASSKSTSPASSRLRESMKGKFEQATGNKLTFTPFFARAVGARHPQVAHHQFVG